MVQLKSTPKIESFVLVETAVTNAVDQREPPLGIPLTHAGDLSRLRGALEWLDERGVEFLATYAECREARALFRGWPTRRIRTRRNIAGFAGNRKRAYELVASNIGMRRDARAS